MPGRQDALVASAEIIGSVQTIALDHAPEGVGTVGELYVQPNSRNTIPGEVWFSVDIRNPQDDALESMGNQFRQICDECAVKHRVVIEVDEIWTKPPVRFDQKCIDAVSEAVSGLGY